MHRKIFFALIFILLSFSIVSASDDETLARQAEQAGRYREALTYYVNALQSATEGSVKDQELREKIIGLVPKIKPAPELSEEAERHMARGFAAVKTAKDEQGFLRAASEFKQVVKLSPWHADGYYNLGVVLDKGGKYPEAVRNLTLYLKALPNAADAKEVKRLIYEIEYRQEDVQRQNQPPDISGVWTRWKDGKWITTQEIRISGQTMELKFLKHDHPSIPPDSQFKVYAKDFSFDGKSFKASQLPQMNPKTKNWQLTVINKDLLIEEWLYEGGENVTYWENGVMKKKMSAPESYRIEWRRER